jgi:hypothetical protein
VQNAIRKMNTFKVTPWHMTICRHMRHFCRELVLDDNFEKLLNIRFNNGICFLNKKLFLNYVKEKDKVVNIVS